MDREQVSLTGTQRTALVTLYGNALDSRRPERPHPTLHRADGLATLRRIVGHVPAGQMPFDAYRRAGVGILQRYPPVKAFGAQLSWSIDDPRAL